MARDPVATARLIQLACVAAQKEFGFLPPNLIDPDLPGWSGPEFRRAASAGIGGNHVSLYTTVAQMTVSQRAAAANDAADEFVKHL